MQTPEPREPHGRAVPFRPSGPANPATGQFPKVVYRPEAGDHPEAELRPEKPRRPDLAPTPGRWRPEHRRGPGINRWQFTAAAVVALVVAGVLTAVLVVGRGSGGPAASLQSTDQSVGEVEPGPKVTAQVVYDGPAARTPQEAVDQAVAYGTAEGGFSRVGVVLLDRRTGQVYSAGDVDGRYRTASLVKLFIAARMLVEHAPFDDSTQNTMYKMITCSWDDGPNILLPRVGGIVNLVAWAAERYGLGDGLQRPYAPTGEPATSWGWTGLSPMALATFYDKVADDEAVFPWLHDAMAHAAEHGCDGYYQHYGLPSAASTWAVKQGWLRSGGWGYTYLHSTGYVDNDHYIAVLLAQGPLSLHGELDDPVVPGTGRWILTGMAQALLPGGHVPVGT